MRAHLVQTDIVWEDRAANHDKVRALLGRAGVAPGDLVLLPEMFDSGFSLNVETTAEGRGETAAFLSALAAEHRCFVHAGTTSLGPDGRGRNRALTFGPDGAAMGAYDKMHPFTYGREGERFSRGDAVTTWALPRGDGTTATVCPVICYDLRFPELFRAGLSRGASVFTVVANWPAGRREHWRALLIARAIENQAVVLGVNRCGKDPFLSYLGGSIAVDAQGHVLAEADAREQVLSVELAWERLDMWRKEFPAWRDRHPGL
ncbi:MAG: carbon-nitrogen family hydrolase [Planctomycetes bacterium]|nr:carbon-nitrogen family hydrolase [Planctomycetota bacterium]